MTKTPLREVSGKSVVEGTVYRYVYIYNGIVNSRNMDM